MLLGMCQASTNEDFLPATSATREQRRAWQNDGCSGLSRSWVAAGPIVACFQRRLPQHCYSPGLLPTFLTFQTQRRYPPAVVMSPGGKGRLFLSSCVAFSTDRWASFVLNRGYLITFCFLLLTLFTHLMNLNCFGDSIWNVRKQRENRLAQYFFPLERWIYYIGFKDFFLTSKTWS